MDNGEKKSIIFFVLGTAVLVAALIALVLFLFGLNNYFGGVTGSRSSGSAQVAWNEEASNLMYERKSILTTGMKIDHPYMVITGFRNFDKEQTAVRIPSRIEGLPVEAIYDNAFAGCANLKTIVIPDTVMSIGQGAFMRCSSLAELIIPDSVASIGSNAFAYCTALESLQIPENVKEIGDAAFAYSGLTEATIPGGIEKLGSAPFAKCASLRKAIFENGIAEIPYRCFYKCDNLAEVIIPDSIRIVKQSAFSGCKKLDNVYFIGTEDAWKKIKIKLFNSPLKNASVRFDLYDGEGLGDRMSDTQLRFQQFAGFIFQLPLMTIKQIRV